ncbi:MAG: hypothetical protein ACRD88_09125 [Terriglobia bacterium]
MQLFFRAVLVLAGLAYLASLSLSLAGQWLLDHPSPENLERGIRWDSRNPAAWIRYARQWHFLPESPESQRAVEAYQHAASLNPFDPNTWKELASVHMERGEREQAEAALRGELASIPHSPQASWRLANFLLLSGRTAEALPLLRTAANEPSLRVAVFDLAWKLEEDPEVILRDLVPATPEVRAHYLQFLLTRGRLAAAYPVWQELSQGDSGPRVRLGNVYAEALARAGMGREAGRVWDEMLALTGRTSLKPPGELLTNGDFEADIPNAGLGWRLTKGAGYQIALDEFTFQNGTRSLRVSFDGTTNVDFAGVWGSVPVEPNRRYRFEGYLRTDSITTDNGLFFTISSMAAPSGEAFSHSTASHVETMGWVREQLDFETGPRTTVVLIQLRRQRSAKLNNLIQGKVWIDHLSLQAREP